MFGEVTAVFKTRFTLCSACGPGFRSALGLVAAGSRLRLHAASAIRRSRRAACASATVSVFRLACGRRSESLVFGRRFNCGRKGQSGRVFSAGESAAGRSSCASVQSGRGLSSGAVGRFKNLRVEDGPRLDLQVDAFR